MSADWKQDHTAAMAHMASDPSRTARIAAIEAEASRMFHSTPSASEGIPLLTPLAFKRSPKSHPPSSLLAAMKYKTSNLLFPAPLDAADIARGFATTTDDDSNDVAEPSDNNAYYLDATESNDEDNDFAKREAVMAGQIKAAMYALAIQRLAQAEASAKKKRTHAKAKSDSKKRHSRIERVARTMESERQLQILLAELELAKAALDENDDGPKLHDEGAGG